MSNTVQKTDKYIVCGYDKDGDIYESIGVYDNKKAAAKRLASITTQHLFEPVRCKSNKEPFDWFIVLKNETDVIATGVVEVKNGRKIAKIIVNS